MNICYFCLLCIHPTFSSTQNFTPHALEGIHSISFPRIGIWHSPHSLEQMIQSTAIQLNPRIFDGTLRGGLSPEVAKCLSESPSFYYLEVACLRLNLLRRKHKGWSIPETSSETFRFIHGYPTLGLCSFINQCNSHLVFVWIFFTFINLNWVSIIYI